MLLQHPLVTAVEFDRWIEQPENAGNLYEFINGEIVEVPSNPFASYIAMRILRWIATFVEAHDLGFVTGEAGGYMVSGERYAPDVGYISKIRQPTLAKQGYNPNPPDLAVEVDFPSTLQSQRALRTKIVNYLAAGTVVWLVLPEVKEIEIFVPGQARRVVRMDETLDGGDVLPGFSLPLSVIFAEA